MKAMHEALIAIRDKCQNIAMGVSPLSKKFHSAEVQALNYCFHASVSALSKPPRNCDVYDAKTAEKEFIRQTGSKSIRSKSVRWLYAPATEQKGEADGGK